MTSARSVVSGRLAFPAMLVGSASLAFGPWMVRIADVGPVASGFWRLALATPVLFLLVRLRGEPLRVSSRLLWPLVAAGIFFAADLAAWHLGIVRTTLANAVLFGNSASIAFAAYGFVIARRLPGRMVTVAMVLAMIGIGLLIGRSVDLSPRHLAGDLLSLAAAGFYTLYLIVVGQARAGGLKPLPLLAWASAAGAAALLPAALLIDGRILPDLWWPLLVLALSSQVFGQGLIVYAVGHLQPVVVGLCLLVQPVIAAVIGLTLFGEKLGAVDMTGALLVLIGLVLVRVPDAKSRQTTPPS